MEYRVIQMGNKAALSPVLLKKTYDPMIAKISALMGSNLYDNIFINAVDGDMFVDTCFIIQKR